MLRSVKHTCRNPVEIVGGRDNRCWALVTIRRRRLPPEHWPVARIIFSDLEAISTLWPEGFTLKLNGGIVRIYSLSPDISKGDGWSSLPAVLLSLRELEALKAGAEPTLPQRWYAKSLDREPLVLDPERYVAAEAIAGKHRADFRAWWIVKKRWDALQRGDDPFQAILEARGGSQMRVTASQTAGVETPPTGFSEPPEGCSPDEGEADDDAEE